VCLSADRGLQGERQPGWWDEFLVCCSL